MYVSIPMYIGILDRTESTLYLHVIRTFDGGGVMEI